MSMQATKDQLVRLLEDAENKVIALSGKWGTGKSHLWGDVRESSNNDTVRRSLYVSLFGLSSMSQVKLKLVQSALPKATERSAMWGKISANVMSAKKVLTSLHQGFSALDELALLAVPTIIEGRVIVLDDIERKHKDLSNDEVLGFIDEFSQQHNSRFVLVLNSDQLANREVWDTLREKVIDQEIRLDTSSSEAFNIAIRLTPSRYATWIRSAVETCQITNIRVIRKVIRAVNRILSDRENLSDALMARVIPSTVLLAAINYKGIDGGPDFDFVLGVGTPGDLEEIRGGEMKQGKKDAKEASWKLMLSELGINSCDDYELLVVEFLQSGLFDLTALSGIIDRYVAENDAIQARSEANRYLQELVWDYHLSDGELLDRAKALIPTVHLVDAYYATALAEEVSKLTGGGEIGEAIIDAWIQGFRAKNFQDFEQDNFFHRQINARIEAEFTAVAVNAQAKTTVFDACMFIAKHSGWGARQELVMKSASVQDFETTIKSLSIDDLRAFMRKMLDLCNSRDAYRTHFGSAMDHFVEACRNITLDVGSAKLGKLLQGLFDDAKLAGQLQSEPASVSAPSQSA